MESNNEYLEKIEKIMSLNDLYVFLALSYGFDFNHRKSRKREIVYAKKVYCKLASEYGYGPTAIGKEIDLKHDNVIHHRDTFTSVLPMDLHHYNMAIKNFNLPIRTISNINELIYGVGMSEVIQKLSALSSADFKLFKTTKLEPFLKALEFEKKIKEMTNG